MKIHPLAELFPLIEGKEFEALVSSIKQNGLLEPIWVDKESAILDGRNSFRACQEANIAVRIRREGYDKYADEFTIRSKRDSGAETEMSKIIKGFGDWFFYGHAKGLNELSKWLLVDLHAFRAALIIKPDLLHNPDNIASGNKATGDGTYFRWFNIKHLPKNVLVARS